ncbi:MAG: hypothetical protein KKF68_03360 [Nanoarchaeota archaeon]|nr:hypothetical protein [Nanoarchaeota archaeon]
MKIGIIGPSKLKFLEEVNPSAKEVLSFLAKKLAREKNKIVITPDKGSVSEYLAQIYLKNKGKKILEIIPEEDTEFGYNEWVNTELGEIINCGTWRNQPEKLNEETDVLLCVGYAVGVLAEIAYSKWFNPKPVYIIKELISESLPKELEKSLDLRYVSYKDLQIENEK